MLIHMRHFRGSRRRSGPPRGGIVSNKYVVDEAESTEVAGLQVFQMALGVDGTTMSQTGVTDTSVPSGAKITKLDIRVSYSNLASLSAFVHWAIELRLSGQASINPITVGGSPLRTIVMLSGVKSVGDNQNQDIHIVYKIPPKFQRMKDGMQWQWTANLGQLMQTVKQVVYKVYQ